jgi:hypothetical protein
MDRVTGADDIRRLLASPDVAVGSVAALTEAGSLVVASASGSQLPGHAGGAARAIWIVGAQKVVPDLSTALRRVEDHALPLESARAQGHSAGCEVWPWLARSNSRLCARAQERSGCPRGPDVADPLREALAGELGEDGGEGADVAAGGLEFGAAFQRGRELGLLVSVREPGWRVSQPVASRTVGRAGGERRLGWRVLVKVVADGGVAAGVPARADLAVQLGEVAAAFLYAPVQVGLERVRLADAPVPGRADPARRIFGRAGGSLAPRGHQ